MLGVSCIEHKTNKCVGPWQRVNILAGRLELLMSTVTGYHGSAMSVVVIRRRRSYYNEQWMIVVADEDIANHGKTTPRHEQASR